MEEISDNQQHRFSSVRSPELLISRGILGTFANSSAANLCRLTKMTAIKGTNPNPAIPIKTSKQNNQSTKSTGKKNFLRERERTNSNKEKITRELLKLKTFIDTYQIYT